MQTSAKSLLAAAALFALPCALAQGQSFPATSEQAESDLKTALTELAETRGEIAAEKIPLIREVSSLEDSVRQKSDELDRLRRLRDNSDLGLNRLREQVEAIEAQNEYAAGFLD